MRIAIDVSGALGSASGIRCYIEELIQALARIDQINDYFCYAAFGREFAARTTAFPIPRQANFHPLFVRFPERLLSVLEERLGRSLQERWLNQSGISLFHGTANLVPPMQTLPAVVTLHHVGGPPDRRSARRQFYNEERTRRSLARAQRVIAISEFTRKEAIAQHSLDPDRVETVWEGINAAFFADPGPIDWVRRLIPSPYILFVSAINVRKNLVRLVQAFQQLKAQRSLAHRLVLVGKKHESYPDLLAEIRRLGIENDVQFLEGVTAPQLSALYHQADLFVYPSLLEGFGLPLLEAMACGIPVVTTRATCLPEIAGSAALFFNGTDVSDLVQKIEQALFDKGLRQELIRKGHERVALFTWEETARKTLAIYQKITRSG